jgi:23S rRNA (guanosine2251-2'-O)-methyltransferase
VATALCVYEVARRNWMKDIHGQAPSPPIVRPQMKTQEVSPPAPPLSEPPVGETSNADPSNTDPSNTELSASDHPSEDNASLHQQLFDSPGSDKADLMKTESPQADSSSPAPTIELDLSGSKPEPDLQFDQSIKLSP